MTSPVRSPPAAAVRFRPGRKRATFRARRRADADANDDDDDNDNNGKGGGGPVVRAAADAAAVPRRRGGVAFASAPAGPEAATAAAVVPRDAPADDPGARGFADRFMRQTGLVADPDDRHMTEYIESRLSSRLALPPLPSSPASGLGQPLGPASVSAVRAGDQPTKHGKLFEVDIPADVRSRRDDARRGAADGPPRPPHGRNRRGSDDMKRDHFVDQFLHENKLDVYDIPSRSAHPHSSASTDHRSADDRMADQFRRQYLEDLVRRRQRRRHAHRPRQPPPPPGDILRGPKLGGSRNSRAAVRNLLLRQEKEKLGRKV